MQEILTLLIPIVVAHVLVLVAIIFIIKRLLLGDTARAMQRIQQVESDVRKKEEGIRRQISEHEEEFARRKTEAEEELETRREEAEKEAAQTREQVVTEARQEADRIIEQAKRNEEKIRDQVMLEMEEKAVDYAAEIFRLVFSDRMTEAVNAVFIDELLDALEEVDGSSITVDASEAEFTTSHPLAPEQKQRLQQLLTEKFGADVEVQETVQEDLIAGMILKLGSLEIDGSLLNRYREAASEAKKNAGA